jgi:glycerol-3-phosphate cytidylyltransferase
MTRTVITYGTFDLFHIGHLRLLQRLRALGDRLIVAVSTDEFNAVKGKKTTIRFEDRCDIVRNLRCVDLVIAERHWGQKPADILHHDVALFGMGSDWTGKFDDLRACCDVIYLPRTEGVSSTQIKRSVCAVAVP